MTRVDWVTRWKGYTAAAIASIGTVWLCSMNGDRTEGALWGLLLAGIFAVMGASVVIFAIRRGET